jgi:hypothetical protein
MRVTLQQHTANKEEQDVATYRSFQDGTDSSNLFELDVLNDGTITVAPDGSSVTYGNDPDLPGFTVQLIGTGISGSPAASWNIQEIISYHNGQLGRTITDITGVDGAPTSGSFDADSIFQAAAFHNAARLIFRGHDNVIQGGPGVEGLFGFGIEGTHQVVHAGNGNELVSGNGGINTVYAGKGHDVFLFNYLDENNPNANISTIHGYNVARDKIELNRFVFDPLFGHPELLASEFHIGANPAGGAPQIVYNPANGHLSFDFFSSFLGHEVKELFAVLDTTNIHHHPTPTAADLLVA